MRKITGILGLLLLSASAFAQQRIATYSDIKKDLWTVRVYENDPLNVREYTLKNGLKVITSINKAQPRIYTMVAVKTGSKNDPANHTGLAHYLEHMLFKGTDKFGSLDWSKEKPLLDQIDTLYEHYNHTTDPKLRKIIYHNIDSVSLLASKYAIASEFDKMCQSMGAEGTNAFTSNEETVYVNDVPSNMLHKWTLLQAERFRNPVLRLFHTELEAVYEEKNMGLDNDYTKVWEKLYAELFQKHNYGQQTTIGTIEHLKNPSLTAIRDYYNKYYVPNNMAIILSGDFDPDSTLLDIAKNFAWMQPKTVEPYAFEPENLHGWPRKFDVTGPDAESLSIGFTLPGAKSKEARIAKMIDLLLNNSSAGLIDLNLVKKQQVLSAYSGVQVLNDYSVFFLGGTPCKGQTLHELDSLLMGQMQLIQNGKFDDSLLKAIILNEEISKISNYKENSARSNFLMESFINGSDYLHAWNELWEMTRIKKEEIMEMAKEFLDKNRVEIYKHQGKDTTVKKIEKPAISQVELNRDKQSDFLTQWMKVPSNHITPVYADFVNGIKKSDMGPVQLLYTKNKDNRLFTMYYWFEYGERHNKKMPLALDYLKFLGTAAKTSEQISKELYYLGCKFQTWSSDRRSYVNITGPEENYDAALKIVEDLMKNAVPNEEALSKMISNTEKKRADNKLNNDWIDYQLFQYSLYGKDNPATWQLDSTELRALKSAELVQLIHSLNAKPHKISYYGQREEASLRETLTLQHKIPAVFETINPPKVFVMNENKENEVFFAHYPQVQSSIYWTNKGSIYNAKEDPKMSLFNQYFGGDLSSVVFQSIRESKALAYSTYAGYYPPSLAGEPNYTLAFIGCQADKFNDAIGAMNELLDKIPADSNAFAIAKESLRKSIETNRIDEETIVYYYFQLADLGITTDRREMLYNALPSLTMDDIIAFHADRLKGKKYSYAVVADKTKITEKDLKKYGKVTVLTLKDIFGY